MPILPNLFKTSEKEKSSSSDPKPKEHAQPKSEISEKATTSDQPKTSQKSPTTDEIRIFQPPPPSFIPSGYRFRNPYYPSNDFVRKNDCIPRDQFENFLKSLVSAELSPLVTKIQEEIARKWSLVLGNMGKLKTRYTSGTCPEEVEPPSYSATHTAPCEMHNNDYITSPRHTDPLRIISQDPEESAHQSHLGATKPLRSSVHLPVINTRPVVPTPSFYPGQRTYITFSELMGPEQIKKCVRSYVADELSSQLMKVKDELERQNMVLECLDLGRDEGDEGRLFSYVCVHDEVRRGSPPGQAQIDTGDDDITKVPISHSENIKSPTAESSHNQNPIDEVWHESLTALVSQDELDEVPQRV